MRAAKPLAFVLAALAFGLAACTTPATPTNRPNVPAGVTNGALPEPDLADVNGCVVARVAANSLQTMLRDAADAGISLLTNSCYRNYEGQQAARSQWCAKGSCRNAAVPGTSNHGWGRAVDLGTEGGITFESPAYKWLKERAWIYGWNHPGWAEPGGSAPEPWHWEWVGDGGQQFPGQTRGPQ
jgi:LAS superfamily LD-carboxypeptidase LdcB